jgi:hypothetical protein
MSRVCVDEVTSVTSRFEAARATYVLAETARARFGSQRNYHVFLQKIRIRNAAQQMSFGGDQAHQLNERQQAMRQLGGEGRGSSLISATTSVPLSRTASKSGCRSCGELNGAQNFRDGRLLLDEQARL